MRFLIDAQLTPSFAGHAAMENRHGLCVLFDVTPAVGAPESAVSVD